MLWAGTTDSEHTEVDMVPAQGALTRDWSCAMPPLNVGIMTKPWTWVHI
jgi:proteasome assembly chaperone 4